MKLATKFLITFVILTLGACGGSGGGGGSSSRSPMAVSPVFEVLATKTFRFSWTDVTGATLYRVLENSDGLSGFVQASDDIPVGTERYDHTVPLYARLNAQYIVQACNENACTDSAPLLVLDSLAQGIGYFKASNSDSGDSFGFDVRLSGDGNTLAVGAPDENSAAIGVAGSQIDNSVENAGAVYVFVRNGGSWIQQSYLKASNSDANDNFGSTLSLSGDGNTLAVGTFFEDSAAVGIDGNQTDNSAEFSGAVYLFARSNGIWAQQAYIKASNTEANDLFGFSLSLDADGNTLAVSANREGSASTGVNGNQADNSAEGAGAVYLFGRNNGLWAQQAYLKASNADANDQFGIRVSLSADGNSLAIGANGESSAAMGINGNSADNSAQDSGAVYVFSREDGLWEQQIYLKSSNTEEGDRFGAYVSLSADGETLAVGALAEDSSTTGINGDQSDNSAGLAGAVYVFTRDSGTWTQQAYLKASNTDTFDFFGNSVSLSANGNALAVGAFGENSAATGINGNQADNTKSTVGAVYLFTRGGGSWIQQAYLKAGNADAEDQFGSVVSLSADGNTLAVGANGEDGAGVGVIAVQADNSAEDAGAVYLF